MSGTRLNPWLADHVIFFSYRWLAWAATAAVLLAQGRVAEYIPLLIVAAVVNALATLFAQRYVRIAQRNPLTMGVDIVYAVLVLVWSGGWQSPFTFYAYSSLVLPGLLYGWRGAIMSGLSFAALFPAAQWAAGSAPSDFVAEDGWLNFARVMAGPPVFAVVLPGLVELLRRVAAQRARERSRTPPAPRLDRAVNADPVRFVPVGRGPIRGRGDLPDEAPLIAQATKIR
ncbi:MAG TPA: histidine kinase, partial [Roseiflexaceae bacterium]